MSGKETTVTDINIGVGLHVVFGRWYLP